MNLRSYQSDVILYLRSKFKNGAKSVGLIMPTGAGKSKAATYLIADLKKKKIMNFQIPQKIFMNGYITK